MVCMGVTEVVFLIDDIDVGIMWEAWKVENRVGETSRVVWARGIGWGWEGSDEKRGSATGTAKEGKIIAKGPVMKLNHPKVGSQKASGSEQRNGV